MAYDGIITKAVVNELNNSILNGRIDKIFEPSKLEIILGIYNNKTNYALYLSTHPVNYRCHLTTRAKPNPATALNFCMVLRKHLLGFRITKISSFDLERIIELELEGLNELHDVVNKKLIIEIMGKHSNIILVNSNNIIIDSLKHVDTSISSFREVLIAREYVSPKKAENNTWMQKYNNVDDVISAIDNNSVLCEISEDKKDYILTINKNTEVLPVNFFLDDFYFNKEDLEKYINYKNSLFKIITDTLSKYTKRIKNIKNKIDDCKDMDKYKMYGDLIISNLYKINPNDTSVTLENFYDNNNLITIPLDNSLSPSHNANKYFKKYNKLKNTLKIVEQQRLDTLEEIKYVESLVYEIQDSSDYENLREIELELIENGLTKKTYLKNKKDIVSEPLKFIIDGFIVLVGKNNKQNELLTLKTARNSDIWFHTKTVHGSHVVLKVENKQITDNVLLKCAELAAYYSKAKETSKVEVDYTYIKNVKKIPGSKTGMVNYTDFKTLVVKPKMY